MGLAPIAFTTPLVLIALALLPLIWWLLRLTPPQPRRIAFPPLRLLQDISKREETPDKSPWWLTALRMLLAAVIILAVAGPIWRPAETRTLTQAPLWLIIDNGWASAKSWKTQQRLAQQLLTSADAAGAPVIIAATADGPTQPFTQGSANAAKDRLRAIEPNAWETNRVSILAGLEKAAQNHAPGLVAWLSDGIATENSPNFPSELVRLAQGAEIDVYTGLQTPLILAEARNASDALTARLLQFQNSVHSPANLKSSLSPNDDALGEGENGDVTINAFDLRGLLLGQVNVSAEPSGTERNVRFDLPIELRNEIVRLEITGQQSAAATQLLDDRWRRRSVALVSGATTNRAQPLLSPLYYLERALEPYAELRIPRAPDLAQAIPEAIKQGVSAIILTDIGKLPAPTEEALVEWIKNGGFLIRFAGPKMASGANKLIPTPLRRGDRSIGGSLSWLEPQAIGGFSDASPFAGMQIPADVAISRQVLAEPGPDLAQKTWAWLEDGTPLVTAAPLGNGEIVLFHVTADNSWSNLPLSGAFLEMLRKTIAASDARKSGASPSANENADDVLPPFRLLDGYGRFIPPGPDAEPLPIADVDDLTASRVHPAGFYGSSEAFLAVNVFPKAPTLTPLDLSNLTPAPTIQAYPATAPLDLRPFFFLLALLLLFVDAAAMLLLRGDFSRLKLELPLSRILTPAFALAALASAFVLASPGVSGAQESEIFALDATLTTPLAYVVTGDDDLDTISRAGLAELSRYLSHRTALEPGAPVGVNIAKDELSFFPLLYWPISRTMEKPSAATMSKIATYMRNGGALLLDTRDTLSAGVSNTAATPETMKLREILADLDIPPLEPAPADHVLTKTFYLLNNFPGRFNASPLWVEARSAPGETRDTAASDGVSPILITGNDFAGAWASDASGGFLLPTVPADPLQREYAFRAGVNIVMYVLTGNYKADQVHVPTLLERLGQ